MVTAILIPIICIYFYWLTSKEIKENEARWNALTNVHEEAIITGRIQNIIQIKKRFYYHRYVHITEIHLQTELKVVKVTRVIPYTMKLPPLPIEIGNTIRVFGNWNADEFRFLRLEVLNDK